MYKRAIGRPKPTLKILGNDALRREKEFIDTAPKARRKPLALSAEGRHCRTLRGVNHSDPRS